MSLALRSSAPILALAMALGACTQMQQAGQDVAAVAEGEGACGAGPFESFVGQRVDALNDVELPAGARVLFPTTPATMDFNPERLNVTVDADDMITRVYCG